MIDQILAFLFLVIMTGLTVFQILLILGKPFGEYAWGGQNKILPKNLRIASISSILIYVMIILVVLNRAGLINFFIDDNLSNTLYWVVTGYFGLGIFVNAISRSKKERNLMTPLVALLFLICLIIGS